MDLELFTNTLQNTAEHLADVLAGWSALPEELAAHYAEELVRVAIDLREARSAAVQQGRTDLVPVIGFFTAQLADLADVVNQVTGVALGELLNVPGTSARFEAEPEHANDQFALAA